MVLIGQPAEEPILGAKAMVDDGLWSKHGVPKPEGSSTPLVNDDALAKRLAVPLREVLGDTNVVTEFPPATGSEDVPLLLGPNTHVPFTFLIVGVADPAVFAAAQKQGKLRPYWAHNPDFVVDLKAIRVGTKIATVSMLELLARNPAN